MCFFPKAKEPKVSNPLAEPDKTADPVDIGNNRKAEDKTLFGGIPDLRVDRSAAPASIPAGGAGLGTLK
jgi:hypothetical protein